MMWGSFGLAISMMLIAVLLSFTPARGYSEKLNKATASASVAFFFTYVSFMALDIRQQHTNDVLDVHLRCISQLYSMVRLSTIS
jgi:preprotein translocase subunit SecG